MNLDWKLEGIGLRPAVVGWTVEHIDLFAAGTGWISEGTDWIVAAFDQTAADIGSKLVLVGQIVEHIDLTAVGTDWTVVASGWIAVHIGSIVVDIDWISEGTDWTVAVSGQTAEDIDLKLEEFEHDFHYNFGYSSGCSFGSDCSGDNFFRMKLLGQIQPVLRIRLVHILRKRIQRYYHSSKNHSSFVLVHMHLILSPMVCMTILQARNHLILLLELQLESEKVQNRKTSYSQNPTYRRIFDFLKIAVTATNSIFHPFLFE